MCESFNCGWRCLVLLAQHFLNRVQKSFQSAVILHSTQIFSVTGGVGGVKKKKKYSVFLWFSSGNKGRAPRQKGQGSRRGMYSRLLFASFFNLRACDPGDARLGPLRGAPPKPEDNCSALSRLCICQPADAAQPATRSITTAEAPTSSHAAPSAVAPNAIPPQTLRTFSSVL